MKIKLLLYHFLVLEERGMKRISKILMILCVLAAFGLMACDTGVGGAATPTPTPSATPVATVPVNVSAMIVDEAPMFGDFAYITVSSGGTAITAGLTITVGGEPCVYDDTMFHGWVGMPTLLPGTDTTVVITGTGINISETIRIPEVPVITDPNTAHSDYDSTAGIPVSWNAFTQAPNAINISVDQAFTVAGSDYSYDATSMTATTHTIPANTLTAGSTGVTVQMNVGNIKVLTGASFEGVSMIQASSSSTSEPFSTATAP
jgi:hypothetical protein